MLPTIKTLKNLKHLKLYKDFNKKPVDHNCVYLGILYDIIRSTEKFYQINPDNNFDYISSNINEAYNFLNSFLVHFKNNINPNINFLECGSGNGLIGLLINNIAIANNNFLYRYTGLEYNKRLIYFSHIIGSHLDKGLVEFKLFDVMQFDDYNKYNLIYFYTPFKQPKLQLKFEKLVYDKCKSNTYILFNTKKEDAIGKTIYDKFIYMKDLTTKFNLGNTYSTIKIYKKP